MDYKENIQPHGVAIQCHVTTKNPECDFAPNTGMISLFQHLAGVGVQMDGIGYTGLASTPFFDSMIGKYTIRGAKFGEAVARIDNNSYPRDTPTKRLQVVYYCITANFNYPTNTTITGRWDHLFILRLEGIDEHVPA